MVMPERAGLPLGDKPNLYFLLEIHYDNSEYHSGKPNSYFSGSKTNYPLSTVSEIAA